LATKGAKVVDKEDVVVKEIITIKNKPTTWHWDNRKDGLRVSQELPH
jgi:hypothetical protein